MSTAEPGHALFYGSPSRVCFDVGDRPRPSIPPWLAMDDRICGTCRHFEWASQPGRGWCRNPRLFTASQSQPVSEFDLACATRQGDYWEASDDLLPRSPVAATEPELTIDRSLEYDEQEVLSGGGQMRGSGADQPRSSDDPMYAQSPDTPATRSGRGSGGSERGASSPGSTGGDRPSSFQTEERYWTDYLRIALPIAGLLLLLSVFWYWASSFIGDDDNGTQTPVVAVNVTPQDQPTMTPTLQDAIQLTPQNPPTATTAAPAEPTQAPQPTQAPAEPTQAPQPTQATNTGAFVEGDLVTVNDNDVNMRAEPSILADVVDTLSQGAELRILSATPTEYTADDGTVYTYWNVSDDALGITGWVVGDFLEP